MAYTTFVKMMYGIAGVEHEYYPCNYWGIGINFDRVDYIKKEAEILKEKNPWVETVYIVDNEPGLRNEYVKAQRGNMDLKVIFKRYLETCGIEVTV